MMMVDNQKIERRPRGRPQVRCDDDTKSVVIAAASRQFHANGYASACIGVIAQEAGVSTKTLYRLFPAKADLFASVISDRIARFNVDLDRALLVRSEVREELEHVLDVYANLALDPETIGINRLVMAEADRFPEIATAFYERAILATSRVIENWLKDQRDRGVIEVEEIGAAAGMLRGMMTMEPQRAAILGQLPPPGPAEIKLRARMCARVFLEGCLAKGHK
jgi:AcrR family transcriptional regulator